MRWSSELPDTDGPLLLEVKCGAAALHRTERSARGPGPIMMDGHYADPDLVALYDVLHPPDAREDLRFYLPMVLAASSVLDIGCGTGALLKAARRAGHPGRLCGLDPARAMLARARQQPDIEWILGTVDDATFDGEFDLIVMTGNAFQAVVDDAAMRATMAGVAAALAPTGRFVFETRHPDAREWESWAANPIAALDADGRMTRLERRVEAVRDNVVTFALAFTRSEWTAPRQALSTIRFHDARGIAELLGAANLEILEQFGDWQRDRPIAGSRQIVTVARRSTPPFGSAC